MENPPNAIPWDRLGPPPRSVSRAVQARVRYEEIKLAIGPSSTFPGLWFVVVGLLLTVFGVAWFFGADDDLFPIAGVFFSAGGIAVLASLIAFLFARGTRRIKLLRNGKFAPGTISKIWDQSRLNYSTFQVLSQDVSDFHQRLHYKPSLLARVGEQMIRWPCKVWVVDDGGASREIKTRLKLDALMTGEGRDPNVVVLCDLANADEGIAASDFYAGLSISTNGQWVVPDDDCALVYIGTILRCALPVVATYLAAVLGMTWSGGIPQDFREHVSTIAGIGIVAGLTVTHVLAPAILLQFMLRSASRFTAIIDTSGMRKLMRAFLGVHRGVVWLVAVLWFGAPIVALAYLTGWLSLAWAAIHFAFAKRNVRAWTFVEYGSTSLALLLFLIYFSDKDLFPWGIALIVLQALLLSVLDLTVRERWLQTSAPATDMDDALPTNDA